MAVINVEALSVEVAELSGLTIRVRWLSDYVTRCCLLSSELNVSKIKTTRVQRNMPDSF